MPACALLDLLRPVMWLALAAFLAGFLSNLALGERPATARAEPAAYAPAPRAPSSEDWNLPKRV